MGRIKSRAVTARRRDATGERELRGVLEAARLDLRALYRAGDQLGIGQNLPAELQALQELDADFAEALWVLDQPRGQFDLARMRRDTEASLTHLPLARERYLATLAPTERELLLARAATLRAALPPDTAYLEIPGRDPEAGGSG